MHARCRWLLEVIPLIVNAAAGRVGERAAGSAEAGPRGRRDDQEHRGLAEQRGVEP
jgi:hypothetical protein